MLEDIKGAHPPPARTVTVEIGGLDARPRLVIMGPGSVLEIKNTGKMTHELSTPETTSLMPVERLPPGSARHVKFETVGGYRRARRRVPAHHDLGDRRRLAVLLDARRARRVLGRGRARRQGEAEASGRAAPGPPSRTSTPRKKEDLTIKVAAPNEKDAAE